MYRDPKSWDQMILGNRLKEAVDDILARMRYNADHGLELEYGANPEATCLKLGVEIDVGGMRFRGLDF